MRFYTLDTVFTFGQYKGRTLKEVLEVQVSYLDYCLISLDHFCISHKTIEDIKQLRPTFYLSSRAQEKLNEKLLNWEMSHDRVQENYKQDYKFYTIETQINYGKHAGLTIREILMAIPSYIDWSLINISHFCISDRTLRDLKKARVDFNLSAEAEKRRREKNAKFGTKRETEVDDFDDGYLEYLKETEDEEDNYPRDYKSKNCPVCDDSPCSCSDPQHNW